MFDVPCGVVQCGGSSQREAFRPDADRRSRKITNDLRIEMGTPEWISRGQREETRRGCDQEWRMRWLVKELKDQTE